MSASNGCRWGILSTAGIARKNWEAIFHSGNGQVVAVASRDESTAQDFIDECQSEVRFPEAPMALGSYETLLAREDIDAVYVPLPTGLRKEWVIKAARAGKHVLCEKPCASSVAELEEMLAACREANVQFMDGVMFMHSARLAEMRRVLDDGQSVGDLRRIATQFTFNAPDDFLKNNIRMHSELEPFGCLGDLGWYTLRLTLWAVNYEMPQAVTGRMLAALGREDSPDSVPMQFSGELFFPGGVTASFYNSFQTEHLQQASFAGSKGYLSLSDFSLPFYASDLGFEVTNSRFEVTGCQFNMARGRRFPRIEEYANNHPTAQETNLFRTFNRLVLGGEPDPHWPEIALRTQRVLEACLKSARDGGGEVTL